MAMVDAYLYVHMKYKNIPITFVMKFLLLLLYTSLTVFVSAQKNRIPWRKDPLSTNIAVRFSPRSCSLCESKADEWNKIMEQGIDNVKVYSVDCDVQVKLCNSMNVTSYPTIMMRTFESWNTFILPLSYLNETLHSAPSVCTFPDQISSCHPKTLQWIEENSEDDFHKYEELFKAEEMMFNVGIADLSKDFMEKKIVWMQLQQWRNALTKKDL